jgi:hypothetical protein
MRGSKEAPCSAVPVSLEEVVGGSKDRGVRREERGVRREERGKRKEERGNFSTLDFTKSPNELWSVIGGQILPLL